MRLTNYVDRTSSHTWNEESRRAASELILGRACSRSTAGRELVIEVLSYHSSNRLLEESIELAKSCLLIRSDPFTQYSNEVHIFLVAVGQSPRVVRGRLWHKTPGPAPTIGGETTHDGRWWS